MGWTLTSAAVKAGAALGLRPRWASPYATAHAAGRAQRGERAGRNTIFERAYVRARGRAHPADAKALDAALSEVGDDAAVIQRAVAAGAPVAAVASFAAAWEKLPGSVRDVIRHPAGSVGDALPATVLFGTVPARQVDQTTCGAAVMGMMLMMGDPLVAAWVMTGRSFGDYLPREVLHATMVDSEMRTVENRWHALQRVLHLNTTRRGLALGPWPRAWGTPPWRVDNHTRYAGVSFRGAILDDTNAGAVDAMVAHASAALRDGIPVPLYTSGDSRLGLDTVMPRHVVLLVGRTEAGFEVYEPGSGRVVPLAEARLYGPGPREAAYGNWTRAAWLVLPRVRRSPLRD